MKIQTQIVLTAVTSILLAACQPSSREVFWRVGVAAAPINPPLGSFIAGDKQNRRFTGIHDSLYAKAVVVQRGEEQLAIVTLDCIGLLYPDVLRIRQRAAELCKFPPSRIMISSTHTHSGPDVVGLWGRDYQHAGVDSAYMAFLINTAALQIQKATARATAAKIVVAETSFGEPWVKNISNEEIDRSVGILQFQDAAGKPLATLTNFACHPTFLDATYSEVSADYVHGYYHTMKQATGGEALFLQGAIGGWVQPDDGAGTFAKAFQRGRELAEEVLKALPKGTSLAGNRILFASKTIQLRVENEAWRQLAAIGTIQRAVQEHVDTEVAWFAIGEAQFITHPGETPPLYGLENKRRMGTGPRFVLGLTNDALGYILKPSFFEDPTIPHAPYLTSMSLGKEAGPDLMRELESLLDR